MSNITTRAGKGSPLTNNELDANFTNLNSDKVEIGGDLSGTSSAPSVAKIQGRAVSTDAPAAGEKLVWNGTAWEPSTEPTGEPIGHADKAQSSISFNSGTRTFTIAPVATEFVVWCKGVKYTYTSAQTVVIPNTTGLHFIYFNQSGVLSTQMSYFTWEDHAPTAYVYWNATTSTAVYFGDERHGITLDWQTHEYLHRTRGAAIANGFAASGYTTTGLGATDADAQIDIGGGTFFDEDMQVDIVSTNSPVANTWQQDLSGPARIPVLYLSGGAWVIDAPTNFPFKVVAGVPQYNLYSGGAWSTASVSNNEYFVSWILATNNLNYPVVSIISQAPTNQLSQAEAMTFEGLSLSGFPSVEFRPLYKVIYTYKTGFTNSVKSSTVAVYDLRSLQSAGVAAALVQDHGNLSGLSDDDHAQYLHVSEVRSPSAAVKNSFLPSQASNSGKYLSTDGTNPSWVAIPSGSLNFTGDVTGTGTTGSPVALTLANSGVTAGTYSKVTVDGKGRVTVGTNIASGDVTTALGFTPENAANKGVANGYAGLDSSGKIASSHLPSYVDDVLEYANLAAFPATGDSGKIYIAIDSAKVYRWSGSTYVEISASPGSTDAVPEGSTNLYHTTSRVRTSISASGSLSYNNTTGVFSYTQPTNVSTFTNDSGYLTGITGTQVTTALGYTPLSPSANVTVSGFYNFTNANGININSDGYLKSGATGYAASVNLQAQRYNYAIISAIENTSNAERLILRGAGGDTSLYAGGVEKFTLAENNSHSLTGSLSVTGTITGTLSGNASSATALQTARTINGVSFDGTANITVGRLYDEGGSGSSIRLSSGNELEYYSAAGTIGTMYLNYSSADANSVRGPGGSTFINSSNYNSYALPLSGGTVTGPITIDSTGSLVYTTGSGTYIPYPQGAAYRTATSAITGAIEIDLPTAAAATNDMISFWVDIYDYAAQETFSLHIGGYARTTSGNQWNNTYAAIFSKRLDRDFTVRFCYDGTRHSVCIGEVNSTWTYPQVTVRDFTAGYTVSSADWNDDWAINFVTTLPTTIQSQTSNYPTGKQLFGDSRQLIASGAAWASYDAYSADNNESGMRFYDSAGGWRATFYGSGVDQGFLSSSGAWDLQKAVNGELSLVVSGSTRTALHSGNYNSYSPTLTGGGASGTWGISITGSSASTTGNAATATTLATARTINGTSFNGSANITTANWGTARTLTIGSTGKAVDGSANVSWTLAEIGALASGDKAADAQLLDGYDSTAFSGPVSAVKQFFWSSLQAASTQARTFEIARLGIDYNDWNSTGPFEIELYEGYYSRGLKKRYVVSYGYTQNASIQLVEYSGSGDNNFQARIGSPVQVSGDVYYLPVFVDVRYYAGCSVRVTTNRTITESNPPGVGQTYINASPGAVNISDFTADSTVNFASTTAVQISGSQLLHAGNYSSYALPLSGGSLTGNITLTQGTDRLISIGSSTNWSYTLKSEGDQFRLYDGNGTNFLYGVYNGGGTGKYLQLLGSNFVVNNNGTVTASGNQILHAGNYSGYALPLTGGTLSGKLTITASAGLDLFRLTFDADGTDSWYRAGSGNRHRFTTTGGADFIIGNGSGVATLNGNQLLTAGNYTSYSPSLTGSGASGTWGINVTGNAATATTASNSTNLGGSAATYYDHRRYTDSTTYLGGYYVSGGSEKPNNAIFGAGKLKIAMLSGGNLGFGGSWNDVLWMSTYTGGDVKASYAIVGDKYSDELYFSRQNYDSASWGTGRRILHSGNYTSFSPSLTGSGASGTWGISITGDSATTSQRNFSGDIATTGQGRFTGWYGGGSGNNALATEIGVSGGASYIISYNRSSSSYATLVFNGANIQLVPQGGTLTGPSGNVLLHAGNYSSYALPLSGGTITGSITGIAPSVQSAITGVSAWNTAFRTSETNVGTTAGYIPGFGQTSVYTSGYRSHMVVGSYRTASSWGGGPFIAWGGNDSYTTEAWLFNTGGSITHTGGRTFLDSSNYSSYALPLSGGTLTGGLTGTLAAFTASTQGTAIIRLNQTDASTGYYLILGQRNGTEVFRVDRDGNVVASGNITAYSDERVKTNWRSVRSDFIEALAAVKSGIYDRTDIEVTQAGVSAQSLRPVLSETVIESAEGELSVAYGNAAMVSAVELAKELVQLKRELAELKSKLH